MKGTRPRSRAFAGRARPVRAKRGEPAQRVDWAGTAGDTCDGEGGWPTTPLRRATQRFRPLPIEWLNETTGEIRLLRAQDVLSGFELERAFLWHIHGRPDGRGRVLRPGEPGWLAAGGYTVRERP
jgi:hypothetical protein